MHTIVYIAIEQPHRRHKLTFASQVVTGLATLQSAVSDLSRAYIAHTNTILGKGASVSFEQINFTTPLGGENGLFSARAATPATAPEQPVEGKKRKRAPHDKNAPKRALTPFFLYLQNQRATITQELGENCTAKEVQDEGGKRWREMAQKEKDVRFHLLSSIFYLFPMYLQQADRVT